MRARPLLAAALVVVALVAMRLVAAEESRGHTKPDAQWSETVGGLRGRIVLTRSAVVNGTPIISTYLVLQNVSDVMNPLEFAWSIERMKFRVVDADGKELRVANVSYDGLFLAGDMNLVLPLRGELSFDISAHGAGIQGDKAALLDLTPISTWTIDRGEPDHYLEAVLEVQKPNERRDGVTRPWHGRIELPRVLIPVRPIPIDAAPTEERIDELGVKLLDHNGRVSEEAERALSLIDDPRVIPWYLKALETNSRGMKLRVLDKLSRFNNDEALAGVKKAMTTKKSDIGITATEALAESSAGDVRHSVALALARSPHPEAKRLLLTMRDDPDYSVRLTVVPTFGRMDTQESLELLKSMSADRDESVRGEAERFLKLRAEKGPVGKQP